MWSIPRIIIHIIPRHMNAKKMKLGLTTPAVARARAMTIIGMQQAIIIQ